MIALDVGVTSIECDVHLTRDDVVVIFHDAEITDRLCAPRLGLVNPLVRSLTLEQLRGFSVGPAAPPVSAAASRAITAKKTGKRWPSCTTMMTPKCAPTAWEL